MNFFEFAISIFIMLVVGEILWPSKFWTKGGPR